ncbi:hypothetical protein D3C87_1312810 [compost metagenome]
MKYAIPFLLMLLTGCFETAPVRPVVPEKETVNIPPEDLRRCPELPRMEERDYDQLDTATFLHSWISIYDVCSGRQERLSNIARKAFNLPETPEK